MDGMTVAASYVNTCYNIFNTSNKYKDVGMWRVIDKFDHTHTHTWQNVRMNYGKYINTSGIKWNISESSV